MKHESPLRLIIHNPVRGDFVHFSENLEKMGLFGPSYTHFGLLKKRNRACLVGPASRRNQTKISEIIAFWW
jgi:hypothetical protein